MENHDVEMHQHVDTSDPFRAALNGMAARVEKQIANQVDQDSGLNGAGFAEEDVVILNLLSDQVCRENITKVKIEGESRLKRLENECDLALKIRRKRIDDLRVRMRIFDSFVSKIIAKAKMKNLLFERRIRQQQETATRRLQELVFECLGESEKSLERLEKCTREKESKCGEQLRLTSTTLRWKLFIKRLEEDSLGNLRTEDVNKFQDRNTFERIGDTYYKEIRKSLSSSAIEEEDGINYYEKTTGKIKLDGVNDDCDNSELHHENATRQANGFKMNSKKSSIQFERLALVTYDAKNANAAEKSIVKPPRISTCNSGKFRKSTSVAEFDTETHGVLSDLFGDSGIRTVIKDLGKETKVNAGSEEGEEEEENVRNVENYKGGKKLLTKFERRRIKGAQKLPLYNPDMLLSSQTICWLLWPDFGRSPLDSHVYYCLEERVAVATGESLDDLPITTKFLSSVYVGDCSKHLGIDSQSLKAACKGLEEQNKECLYSAAKGNWPRGFNVNRYEGRHRQHYSVEQIEDEFIRHVARSYPDVVVVHGKNGKAFHFVPATVRHLLETVRFMELNTKAFSAQDRTLIREKYGSTNICHNSLGRLYVMIPTEPANRSALHCLKSDESLNEKAQIVPVPNRALDELIGCFVVRSAVVDNNCKLLLENDCQHAVLFPTNLDSVVSTISNGRGQHPTSSSSSDSLASKRSYRDRSRRSSIDKSDNNKHAKDPLESSNKYHAVLASFKNIDEGPTGGRNLDSSSEFYGVVQQSVNEEVMTSQCLWRACTVERCLDNDVGLCYYHQNMYNALVDIDESELKRHLPRQSLESLKRKSDYSSVLKASSLVSELLSNKLASTVNGFCSRAANAAKPKQKKNSQKLSVDQRFLVAKRKQESLLIETELAKMVNQAEGVVVQELERFNEFGVFPSDQLVSIRQQYRELNEERDALFANGQGVKQDENGSPLFPSKYYFLEKEYIRLVDDDDNNNNNKNKTKKKNAQDDTNDDEMTAEVLRERHLIEAELELEFCLRKIAILREKRLQLGSQLPQTVSIPSHHGNYQKKVGNNNNNHNNDNDSDDYYYNNNNKKSNKSNSRHKSGFRRGAPPAIPVGGAVVLPNGTRKKKKNSKRR